MLSTSCASLRRCCCCRSWLALAACSRPRPRRADGGSAGRRRSGRCGQGRPSRSAERLEKHGFEVVAEFDAPDGLRGFAGVVGGQQPAAAYVTADGKHVLVAACSNAEGNDVPPSGGEAGRCTDVGQDVGQAGSQRLGA